MLILSKLLLFPFIAVLLRLFPRTFDREIPKKKKIAISPIAISIAIYMYLKYRDIFLKSIAGRPGNYTFERIKLHLPSLSRMGGSGIPNFMGSVSNFT